MPLMSGTMPPFLGGHLMRMALVLADWPMDMLPNPGLDQEWTSVLARVRSACEADPELAARVEVIHAGVWQVRLDDGMRSLAALCRAVDGDQKQSWGYRVLLFPDKPDWLTAGSQRR